MKRNNFLIALCLCFIALPTFAKPVLDIQHWETSRGVEVYFVESHQLPMVDISMIFDAGSRRDGAQYGIANFTASMLEEGTSDLSANQIAERFDDVGAIFSASTTRDMTVISLRSLIHPPLLNQSLDTYTAVLSDPNFNTKAFNRTEQQLLQALKGQEQSLAHIANKAFYRNIYGHYPYGHPVSGSKNTVSNLKAENLKTFYNKYYVSNNATITLVGDLTLKQARKIAEAITATLPAGEKAPALKNAIYDPQEQEQHINYPSTQTYIQMGELGIAVNDPDYFSLRVGNYILGQGTFQARLFKEVRDKRGLTYGISSHFVPMENEGPFMIVLQARNEAATEAIEVTRQVLNDFIEEGASKAELLAAKKNIIGSFPLGLKSNADIASQLGAIAFYKLPLDYLDTYRDKIKHVSLADITQAFKKHVDPSKMITVTVGPLAKETTKPELVETTEATTKS